MRKVGKGKISGIAMLLLCLLLASCSANSGQSSPASSLSGGNFIVASNPSSLTEPDIIPYEPEPGYSPDSKPPPEAFVPEAPDSDWVQPEMRQYPLATAKNGANISSFNGNSYSAQPFRFRSLVASSLYSTKDIFFIVEETLYYANNTGIYSIKQNVCEIAGNDATGLYLIVPDKNVPQVGYYRSNSGQTSLVHYNPVNGAVTPVISNVQGATVDKSHSVLFYATTQPENNKIGHRCLIKRRDLLTGQETVVFTDEYVPSEYMPPRDVNTIPASHYDAAINIEFYWDKDMIRTLVEYPASSEFAYERVVWFNTNGKIVTDSEVEEIFYENNFGKIGMYQGSYTSYPYDKLVQLGPYWVRAVENRQYDPPDYLVAHEGRELFWLWQSSGQVEYANGLLYCNASIYNGSYSFNLPFEGSMLKINDNMYYKVYDYDDTTAYMTLYRATGSQSNPISFKPLGQFKAEDPAPSSEFSDFLEFFSRHADINVAGQYAIAVSTPGNIMVINTATDHVVAVGTSGYQCFVS